MKTNIKSKINLIFIAIAIMALVSCASSDEDKIPDLILVNGKIITVDSTGRIAEAIAIREDRILAIGSTGDIEALAGEATRRIDLNKRTVTPGLLDSHIHLSSSPWNSPNVVDISYPEAKNIEDIKRLISEKVEKVLPGEWIQAVGLDEGKLEEQRLITAEELDEISPDNPVWLSHTTGHYGVVNTKALEVAEIDRDTENPPEGIIDRDEIGNATGTLKESAMGLIYRKLPPTTVQDIENGIIYMTNALNSEGMTGVKDPTLNNKRWEAYKNVLNSGKLNLRVFGLWMGGKSITATQNALERQLEVQDSFQMGKNHLVSGGIKIFADGSGGARTAWLYDEWNKDITGIDEGNYGFPNIAPYTLREMIKTIHQAGVHASTHAIGDRTIDTVVKIYQEVLKAKPTKGLRHGIIHANIPTDYALGTIKELQNEYDAGYPEPSAAFTWWIGDTYAGNFGERAKHLNPFATFKERGIIWANGSDYAVTPFPARYGIWSSIARQPAVGKYKENPFGEKESVNVETAFKAATIWVARQMFMEDHIGSIEVGKFADLAIWDRDIYSIPTSEIKDMKCLMTIFNGKIVYETEDFKN
jgi:predicted amidohydrolase YtcJ